MGDNVALRNALARIGFSDQASTHIVVDHQFASAADYARLTDDEAIHLCKTTRRPGGTDAAGDPNPGISVSLKAENNLKLMCFFFRYRQRTSRPLTITDVTVNNLDVLHALSRSEADHEDPKQPDIVMKGNWTRTIEEVEDYLRNCLGNTKIPLAWIVRDEENPQPHADDPATNYDTFAEELIARAPHYHTVNGQQVHTQAFKDDNVLVFNKLSLIFRGKDCWTYMSKATRTRNGRMAFFGLKDHFLGKNNVDNQATLAEERLQSVSYTGEGRRWNFEKYVKVQVEQHQILEDLTRHGYAGIDPRSKVRYLLNGIKTKDLETVKSRILSDTTLRSDFDASVNLFQDFIKITRNEPRRANISAIDRRGSGGQPRSESNREYEMLEPDMSIEDRYYTKEEYGRLSDAKKKGLSIKRKNRGHKAGAKDSKVKKGKRTFQKRVVSAVNRYLKTKGDDTEEDDESDEEVPMKDSNEKEISNRDNKALKRKQI